MQIIEFKFDSWKSVKYAIVTHILINPTLIFLNNNNDINSMETLEEMSLMIQHSQFYTSFYIFILLACMLFKK